MACLAGESLGQNLVAVGGTLVGGVQHGKFASLEDLPGWESAAKAPWKVHAPGQSPRKAKFGSVATDDEHCPGGGSIELNFASFPNPANVIVALQGTWNPFPRLPKSLGTENKTYQKVARDALATLGLSGVPVVLKSIDRIDLDGDGTEEVVLHTEAQGDVSSEGTAAYAYSVVIVRRLEKGKVIDRVIPNEGSAGNNAGRDVPETSRLTLEVAGFADLDGDGTLEILISEHGIDYGGDTVWKLGPTGPELLAHESCGA